MHWERNVELFSLLSILQGEGGKGMWVIAFKPNHFPICINMGASACLSNDESRFISLKPVQQFTINRIESGLEQKEYGNSTLVSSGWWIRRLGQAHSEEHSACTRQADVSPLSPTDHASSTQRWRWVPCLRATQDSHLWWLQMDDKLPSLQSSANNSPCMFTPKFYEQSVSSHCWTKNGWCAPLGNLTQVQHVLLKLHYCLAHMSFMHIQQPACDGKLQNHTANCEHPVCPACQYGKACHQSVTQESTAIDTAHLLFGVCVSTNEL